MKHHSQWLLILLLTGALLGSCKPKETNTVTSTPTTSENTDSNKLLPIAYINTDTLLAKYDYFQSATKALSEKEQSATRRLEQKRKKLEQQYIAVQQKVQRGELTANQIAQEEKKFNQRQQNLVNEQQKLQEQLMKETQEVQDTLYSNLRRVLREYADKHGYQYVLSYAEIGSPVLIAPKETDITDEILKILNGQ